MKKQIKVGTAVQWKWLGRSIQGVVKEIYFKPISKTIKNKVIKRNGTIENPAYLVESQAGNLALKLLSEIQINHVERNRSVKPKMFDR